jgi:hypothetical protein
MIGSEGGLYHQFKTGEEFERSLRIHLSLYIRTLIDTRRSGSVAKMEVVTTIEAAHGVLNDEELGYLEHLQIFENSMQVINQFTSDSSRSGFKREQKRRPNFLQIISK